MYDFFPQYLEDTQKTIKTHTSMKNDYDFQLKTTLIGQNRLRRSFYFKKYNVNLV
jgi:hypothetical protein